MSAPLVPSPLDYIGRKRFAFYPPIGDAGPNLWILGASSWGEVEVINVETGRDVWVPRQYVGAVSDNGETLVVGLTQKVDLREHEVVPQRQRRVIEMPVSKEIAAGSHGPAKVVSIRLERRQPGAFQRPSFRIGIVILFVMGLLALVESASR